MSTPEPTTTPEPAPAAAPTQTPAPSPVVYTQAQWEGLQGTAKQHQAKAKQFEDEVRARDTQLAALNTQVADFQAKLATATDTKSQLDAVTAKATQAEALNTRLSTLLEFPALISPPMLELVKSSALAPDALKAQLSVLAQAMPATRPIDPAGGTPPAPQPTGAPVPDDILKEAYKARDAGDYQKYVQLHSDYLELLDQAKGKFIPIAAEQKAQ